MDHFYAFKDAVSVYIYSDKQVAKVELLDPLGSYQNIPRGLGSNRLWDACQELADDWTDPGPDGMDLAKELREECWHEHE